MNNAATVQKMYDAFNRQDVETILKSCAENIEWEYGGTKDIPWLSPRKGISGGREFFKVLQDSLNITKFNPKVILEKDNLVVALFDLDATVKKNGNRISEQDEVHLFYFNDQGKVVRFRHRADTHQQYEALQSTEPRREAGRSETRPTM